MIRTALIYISSFIGLFAFTYYLLSLILLDQSDKRKKIPNDKLPFVTIIIPAYNEEKSINRTIQSALSLDYPKDKIEVMVIDDGSKDKTYSIAKDIKDGRLKVFSKKNAGKASALNFAIKRSKGEIVVTMDADTYVEKDALKLMINYFANPRVMGVAPSMIVHNPKGFFQRINQVEYLLGIFLRKAFSTMESMHVTPGAFTAYRKTFFDKHGLFDVDNITEDMEMALRIQFNRYLLECADEAIAYTNVPSKFKESLDQRKRWYYGWIFNFLKYKKLFSKEFGQMGVFVLPVAVITIFLSIILTVGLMGNALIELKQELDFLKGIDFDFSNVFELNTFVIERFFFHLISDPIVIILVVFIGVLTFYMLFANKRIQKYSSSLFGMFLFILFYSLLLTFWWLTAAFYFVVIKKITWGKK